VGDTRTLQALNATGQPVGALAPGTVLWTHPGDVGGIVPAVPSPTGVADVFAFGNDGTVQAITSDGTTAWTANVGPGASVLADFQGGLVVFGPVYGDPPYSISRLDGLTGQSVFTYTIGQTIDWIWSGVAVHPDGTIFAILGDPYSDDSHPMGQAWVIGVDGSSGAQKFSVPLPDDTAVFSHEPFIMIAGDGYAYVPYVTYSPDTGTQQLKLLRVNSAGASDNIDIKTFTPESENAQLEVGYSSVITNADTGVLLTWGAWNTYSWEPRQPPVPPNTQTYGIAVTTGTGVSVLDAPLVGQVNPALQAQDGSFVGSYGLDMVSFDQSGNVRWIVPNYSPLMATADGGVIATTDYVSATVFDQDGNATGQMANMPTYSWLGNVYEDGPVTRLWLPMADFGLSFGAFAGGSPSPNGAYVKLVQGKVFIPFEIADTKGGKPPQTADFAAKLNARYDPTKMAVNALAFNDGKADAFLDALKVTNSVVAYIGHGWSAVQHPFTTIGLCFAGLQCLAPADLIQVTLPGGTTGIMQPPDGGSTYSLPNGFAPKAEVVILAACGITDSFLNEWHLAAGQVLIFPKYPPGSNNMINLVTAAGDVQFMLDQLSAGIDVTQTLTMVNKGQGYTWQVIPKGANVSFKVPSH
jgi:hypothetical protein